MRQINQGNTTRIETGGSGDNSRQYRWKNLDGQTFYLNPDLLKRFEGGISKQFEQYLNEYHPQELNKYLTHCQAYNKHFESLAI